MFLAGWIAVAATAFASGDVKRLTLPTGTSLSDRPPDVDRDYLDSFNQVCGHDEGVKDKPYVQYFNPLKCFLPPRGIEECRGSPRMCVSECSNTTSLIALDIFTKDGTKTKLLGIVTSHITLFMLEG